MLPFWKNWSYRKISKHWAPKVWVSSFPSVWKKTVSAIMKKLKNDHHFVNINLWKDFKLLTPQSMGLQFSECQQKQNIRVSHYEKIKNGHHFININCMENYWPHPKGLGLQFSECQWKQNISVSHYEKIEKWLPFFKYQSYGKISNYWSLPKVWVSRFLSVYENRISESAIMKKSKMATIS